MPVNSHTRIWRVAGAQFGWLSRGGDKIYWSQHYRDVVSKRYTFSPQVFFHSFFKPLVGEMRKTIEVTSVELNLCFLISPSYCRTIHLLTGARRGRKNSTKYFINQSLRNNIQIKLIKQWLITSILFSTTWHPLSSCFVSVTDHTVTIFVT